MAASKTTNINNLSSIPGVGKSTAKDLSQIGINSVQDLKNKNPEILYNLSNENAGNTQDCCLLYVFRCAVYFANGGRDPEKLKWWKWKDNTTRHYSSRNNGHEKN